MTIAENPGNDAIFEQFAKPTNEPPKRKKSGPKSGAEIDAEQIRQRTERGKARRDNCLKMQQQRERDYVDVEYDAKQAEWLTIDNDFFFR